jgi:hypothetical protein
MQALESRQMFSAAPGGTDTTTPPPINPPITPDPPPVDPPPVDPPPVDPPPVDPPPVDPPPVDPPPVDPPPVIPAPHFATDAFVRVVHIGPERDIKTLKDVKWPGTKDAPTEFLLDPSDTPYVVGQYFLNGKLWIEPADWDNRPTLQLANTFKKKSKSSNSMIAGNPSLNVNGTLIIRGMNTIGGEDTVLLGSAKTGNIDCEDVQMDGGAVWRGSGGNEIYFKDNESLGIARANVYSSYTNPVRSCVIDNSGTDVPVLQGGRMVNGNAIGEAAIRIMNVDELSLIGVKTTPWFYKPGKIWKQDVQLRPSSKHITVIGCDFYQVDIGDMTWRKPAHPIDKVDFIDCTLAKLPSLQLGIAKVTLTNCVVNGKNVTKALK